MVSAVILGIALIGLVEMHARSVMGTMSADEMGRGAEVARQVADQIMSTPMTAFQACGDPNAVLPPPPQGCRGTLGPSRTWTTPAGDPCTRYFRDDGITDATTGAAVALSAADGADPRFHPYRVDVRVARHPDNPAATELHVWVCWQDQATSQGGLIKEIHTSRLKVEGVW